MVNIEETLMATNLDTNYTPILLWREFLLGISLRKVFLGLVLETDVLVGAIGDAISVGLWSGTNAGLSASTTTEAALDTSGYTVTNPATTIVNITLQSEVYIAFRLSTVLREDQQSINWLRSTLHVTANAILDYIDGDIRDVLLAGVGTTQNADSAGTLAYNDIIDIQRAMKGNSWFADDGIPTLVIHPDQEYDILASTTFTETIRYSQGSVPFGGNLGGPLVPLLAGVRVLVSDNMTQALALVITPQTHKFGPNTLFAWKRRYTIEHDREVLNGRDLYVASVRYGRSVLQANAIGLISNC